MNIVEVFLNYREALAAGVFLLTAPLVWAINEALTQAGQMIDEQLRQRPK